MERNVIEDEARLLIEKIRTDNNVNKLLEKMLEYDEYVLFPHSMNVAFISTQICLYLKLDDDLTEDIARGAILHDVGKILIDKGITMKKGNLTSNEYEQMKQHTEFGVFLIADGHFSKTVKDIVMYHHEKEDGSGYYNLRKSEIPLGAKIVGAVDTYNAITSDRYYHEAMNSQYSMKALEDMLYPKNIVNCLSMIHAK